MLLFLCLLLVNLQLLGFTVIFACKKKKSLVIDQLIAILFVTFSWSLLCSIHVVLSSRKGHASDLTMSLHVCSLSVKIPSHPWLEDKLGAST